MARPAASTTHQCGPVPEAWKPDTISTRVMTPIVFCPSEVLWASATSEAVNACPYLKPVSLCVLGVVAEGPTHGYAIAQRLQQAGLGAIRGGTLYPVLTRLETDGLLTSTWREGDGGPGRKVVSLTPTGRAELARRATTPQDHPLTLDLRRRLAAGRGRRR